MSLTAVTGKVTTKGQVTIPQEIRDRLGIHPGSTVEFGVEGEVVTVRKAAPVAERPSSPACAAPRRRG